MFVGLRGNRQRIPSFKLYVARHLDSGKSNDHYPRMSASPLPRAGMAPSCCIQASISMTAQLSVIWPLAKRAKRIC